MGPKSRAMCEGRSSFGSAAKRPKRIPPRHRGPWPRNIRSLMRAKGLTHRPKESGPPPSYATKSVHRHSIRSCRNRLRRFFSSASRTPDSQSSFIASTALRQRFLTSFKSLQPTSLPNSKQGHRAKSLSPGSRSASHHTSQELRIIFLSRS